MVARGTSLLRCRNSHVRQLSIGSFSLRSATDARACRPLVMMSIAVSTLPCLAYASAMCIQKRRGEFSFSSSVHSSVGSSGSVSGSTSTTAVSSSSSSSPADTGMSMLAGMSAKRARRSDDAPGALWPFAAWEAAAMTGRVFGGAGGGCDNWRGSRGIRGKGGQGSVTGGSELVELAGVCLREWW